MVQCHEQITVGRRLRAMVVSGYTLLETSYPPNLRIPPHYHERSNLTIVLAGSLEETAGRSRQSCGPGSVVVKPAGTVHDNHFGPSGARTFVLELPSHDGKPAFSRWASYEWLFGGVFARALIRILLAMRRTDAGGAHEVDEEILYLLSLMRPTDQREHSTQDPPAWLSQVRERLRDAPAHRADVRSLAVEAGVHPVYLARAFRRFYGATMTTYVHELRVQRAAHALSAGRGSLAETAIEQGFADQPHFCRVFKDHMGVTPGEFRRAARGT